MKLIVSLLTLLAALGLPVFGQAQPSKPATQELPAEVREDEKTLRAAKIATDGPSLLKYFQARTLTAERELKLRKWIADLSSEKYIDRARGSLKLSGSGLIALELLREEQKKADLEGWTRINHCIEIITAKSETYLTSAAANVLAHRRPESAVEVLLEYLPSAQWMELKYSLLEALQRLAISDDPMPGTVDPALLAASRDSSPRKRLAVAHVLTKANAKYNKYLLSLSKDSDPEVRYQSALALLHHKDQKGVDTLVGLLTGTPFETAIRAEEVLMALGETEAPQMILKEDAETRQLCQAQWAKWWKAKRGKIDLAKTGLLDYLSPKYKGLLVVCELATRGSLGEITAYGRDKKQRWKLNNVDVPVDFQVLRNGRILVAEHSRNRITEWNKAGKKLWTYQFSSWTVSCQRLRNGNTLMASRNKVVIVNTAGKKIYEQRDTRSSIYYAEYVPNGRVLTINGAGEVNERDLTGKVVVQFRPKKYANYFSSWASVQKLRNGRYLLTAYSPGRVLETDNKGNVLWEVSGSNIPWAYRMPNGQTWICEADRRQIRLVNREGKTIETRKTKGRVFCVRAY